MSLNETYYRILKDLWQNGVEISPRRMKCKELINYSFFIENPKDRIITIEGFETNLKYAKTEYQWYLSGSNRIDWDELIKKIWMRYSDDGITANSAYGYRIFGNDKNVGVNQWRFIIGELTNDRDSRRAVININLPQDKTAIRDNACTIALQFLIRNNKLIMIVYMRSNDCILGLRNDIYCFTKLQEKMSEELNIPLGRYYHNTGSMHVYEKDFERVKKLLENEKV